MLMPPSSWIRSAMLIDQLVLLVVMLVEQQMQLVERRSGDLPVVLLVQVAQRHRVGKELVQVLDALLADVTRPMQSAA